MLVLPLKPAVQVQRFHAAVTASLAVTGIFALLNFLYVEKIQKRKYAGYSKACRDRGVEPLDLDSWLEGQNEHVLANACTCMPTVTTTTATTSNTAATTAPTTTTATAAASKTDTDTTVNSRGSGKGSVRENPGDAAEFEALRRAKLEMVRNYTGE